MDVIGIYMKELLELNMTYFSFLLRFLVIPILVFLTITYWDHKKNKQTHGLCNGHAVWTAIGIHILLAATYTTPWDNYLVATGVWYYNPELVTGLVIGYVPIEEYMFFVLETILAGLWWWFLAKRLPLSPIPSSGFTTSKVIIYLTTCVAALLWLVSVHLFFFGEAKWTYLSILLFWALPPIFIQLLFGADILWHYRKLVAWAITVPGVYLSLMDIIALQETTWSISPSQTTGILFFGILPLEEVLFFFVTNILIAFGLTLLLAHISQERLAGIKEQARTWKARWALRLPSR